MKITIATLIERSIARNEIAHGYLSDMIDSLIVEANEAGDKEMVHDCEFARCVMDGTSMASTDEDASEDRKGIAKIVDTLRANIDGYVYDVDNGDTWEIWGTDEETRKDWRLAIALDR